LILITGATGFIGAHVTEKLLQDKSFVIVAIVRHISNYKNVEELAKKGVRLVEGSFYDEKLIERIYEKFPIKHVIHIAALRGSGVGTQSEYFTVNVEGTEVLLEAAQRHRVKKFIFCSSVGVFGTIPENLPATVKTNFVGDNEYHHSKIIAEEKVHQYIGRGLDAYIIRPAITYGAGDDGFPMTLVNLTRKKQLLLPSKDIKVHLLDVESLSELLIQMIKAGTSNQRVFIAADESPISLKELVNLIHLHLYNTAYPSFLKLPGIVYKVLSFFFKLTGNKKWLTRTLLISRDWYFDMSDTVTTYNFSFSNTKTNFVKRMFG